MALFNCKLGTKKGNIVIKRIEAKNQEALITNLKQEGYFILSVSRLDRKHLQKNFIRFKKKVSNKDIHSFNKEFLVLLRAGIPIVKCIQIIAEKMEDSYFSEILRAVMQDIESGESVSEAFGKYEYIFSGLYTTSLYAGEKSGKLPEAIEGYIDYQAKTEELRHKIVSASLYPVILIAFTVFTVIFLLSYVVPSFTNIYVKSDTTMPAVTTVLLFISEGVKDNIFYIILLMIALFITFKHYRKTDKGNLIIDHWKLSLPHLGEIFLYYSLTKLTRTLSTLIKSGIHIVESLRIVLPLLENKFLEEKFKQVIKGVEEGELFSNSLKNTGSFPDTAIQMISAGETTGALTIILPEITEYYENELKTKIGLMTTLIEPILMILIGLLIGFILIGMYLPIFQMAGKI
jgi:type IV pilus assembly protein PilC